MYEKISCCPICEGTSFTNEMICEDHSTSHEQFVIARCQQCNFLFTNPRPETSQLDNYYNAETYISHNNKSNTLVNTLYKTVRYFTLRSKERLIKKWGNTNKTLLDYGCGTGHFLSHCQTKGWTIAGLEPNHIARKIANSNTGQKVFENIKDVPGKYQVITLWHVLEHVPDLNQTISELTGKLEKSGTLIIAVPNPESWDAKHYKSFWAGYDVPRHLYHFSQSTVKQLLKKHHLKVKKTLPMKLDSYYVSMLSEKYKNNSTNYIQSIINGYKSNRYAQKNHNNYSSLIYILQK